MAEKTVSVRLQAKVDGFTAGMKKAKLSVDELTKADVPTAAKGFADLGNKAALAGAAVAVGLGVAVKRFADFDSAMSAVKANSGATGVELESLREAALRLGADSQFSASEAAQGINELAKAGIQTADVLGGGLKGALDLAAAGQISVAQAAETTASAMTQFSLGGDKATHVADLLTNGANKAQGGVGDLGAALAQTGLVANATGLSIEETTAGLTAFASAGLTGSDAGTSFKTMLQRLSAPTAEAKSKMDELGISAYDSQGQFVGLEAVAGQLKDGLTDLTPAQRNSALATIFGADAIRGANVLYEQGAEGIAKWTAEVTEQGAAARQAAELTDNLKGDIERLGGAFDSVLISTGSGANDALRMLTQNLQGVVETVGQIPGPVLLAGGALTGLALVVPKGIGMFQEYRATLDSVGLSFEKISARGPRAAKGVDIATKATKAFGIAVAAVAVADMLIGLDELGLGVEQFTSDLTKADDVVTAIDKSFAEAAIFEDGTDLGIKSLGDALRATFDPSVGQQAENVVGSVRSMWTDDNLSSMGVAAQRFKDLDAQLSGLVTSGAGEEAARQFQQIAQYAQSQGVSLEDLKSKLPGYAEALAGVSNSANLAAGSGGKLAGTTADLEQQAADAETALDNLRSAIEGLGSPTAAAREASRGFQAAIDDAAASVKENGRTLNDHTEKGRANASALDAIREATLEKVNADYTLTQSTSVATATMQAGRDAFVKAAIAAGKTKEEAEALATKLGLIPSQVPIIVKQTGAEAAGADIDYAARNRDTLITVRRRIAEFKAGQENAANQVRKAGGGPIFGPGTSTSDSIPLWASDGEFMQKAAAVDKYGMHFMEAVNSLRFPAELAHGYAGGGAIQPNYAPRQQVVYVPGGGSSGQGPTYAPTFQVHGADAYDAAQRAMREFEFRVVSGL